MYKELSKNKDNIGKTVLNLDNEGNGTHWTSIKNDNKNKDILYYNDSFGVEPPFNIKNKLILYNPYKEQKDYEKNCGARALNNLRINN